MQAVIDYLVAKPGNNVTVVKTDPSANPEAATYAVFYQKFDPNTGERMADEVVGVNRAKLLERRQELQDEIDGIDEFLKDAEGGKQ